jgi:DNA polymerase
MSQNRKQLASIVASTRALLEAEQEMGLHGIKVPKKKRAAQKKRAKSKKSPVRKAAADLQDKHQQLQALSDQVAQCTRCALHKSRTNTVFARGSADAELVFVGEGPGRDEDLQGFPFVGAAGQLLDRMIAAMGYERDEVYICNVVKCRPPQNRTPLAEEAAACERFLTSQIQLIAPKVLVALGKCAAEQLGVPVDTGGPWRGQWRSWQQIPMMPTYHPAFLLRSPRFKRAVWEDLQQVMAKLGKQPP